MSNKEFEPKGDNVSVSRRKTNPYIGNEVILIDIDHPPEGITLVGPRFPASVFGSLSEDIDLIDSPKRKGSSRSG